MNLQINKRITPAAEAWIQTLQIPKAADQEKVRRCVAEYTQPEAYRDYFNYLVTRIWNAVKSLFGCSSLQLAQKVIQNQWKNKALEIARENKFNTLGTSSFADRPLLATYFATDFLKLCMRVNNPILEQTAVFKDLQSMKLFEDEIAALKGLASSMSKQPEIYVDPKAPLSQLMDTLHKTF